MIEAALAGAAIASVFFAFLTWKMSKNTVSNDVFKTLVQNYEKPEMLLAVHRLYSLRDWCKEHNESIAKVYLRIKQRDFGHLNPLLSTPRDMNVEDTLHNQRRMVSNFYYYLSTSIRHRIIPRKIAYEYWDYRTLDMIRDILLPIGVDDPVYLKWLYNDAKNYDPDRGYIVGAIIAICISILAIFTLFVWMHM
jgi:hypothetical protein